MIELAFNEGAAGALKMASAGTADIAALGLYLDIGDLSDMNAGMAGRKKLLDELFGEYPGVSGEIWNTARTALLRLMAAKTTMEPVRMWVCSGNPAELCGMYFVCHTMAEVKTPLLVVRIPEQIETGDGMVSYRHTGEIYKEALQQYAVQFEESISALRRSVFAAAWEELARENAPLRAVINGNLMGVPQDFYDFALRANMPGGEFRIAQLIGSTLGRVPGTQDQWLYLRIKAMIESQELILVSDEGGHHYLAVVRRGNII